MQVVILVIYLFEVRYAHCEHLQCILANSNLVKYLKQNGTVVHLLHLHVYKILFIATLNIQIEKFPISPDPNL